MMPGERVGQGRLGDDGSSRIRISSYGMERRLCQEVALRWFCELELEQCPGCSARNFTYPSGCSLRARRPWRSERLSAESSQRPPERHGAEYPGSWSPSLTHLKFGLAKPEVLKRLTAITVALRSDRSWRVNVDGELATKTPAKFEVRPKALTVMVPSALPLNHLDLSRPS